MGKSWSKLFNPTSHSRDESSPPTSPPKQDTNSPQQTQPDEPHPKDPITIRNAENSRLHQLPTELVLIIYSYLEDSNPYRPDVSRMVLRATSRRFHAILPGPAEQSGRWSAPNRKGFTAVKNTAYFREICAQEKNGELGAEKLVCGACRQIHERSCFTGVEMTKMPEVRICIGSQGVFNLCPHFRVTYAGLKINPVTVLCNTAHDPLSCLSDEVKTGLWERARTKAEPNKSRIRLIQLKGDEKEGEGIKGDAELRLFELGSGKGAVLEKNLTKGMVLKAVEQTGWKLCPHLHARSGALWLSFLLQEVERERKIPGSWFSLKEESRVWPTHRCSAPNCDTRFSLVKERVLTLKKAVSKEYLVMKVERYLGRMDGADDKKWMAQIVEASKLDDDKLY
jgi:hypothetical protein